MVRGTWVVSPTERARKNSGGSGGGRGGRGFRGDVLEEFFGGGGVEAGHGVADVDEEVVAGGRVGEEGEGDALADAAVVDETAAVEAFAGVYLDQAAGDGEAHGSVSGVGEGAGIGRAGD